MTDDYVAYQTISRGYGGHERINHSEKVYVDGDVHTNTIEGFFGIFKNSIRGTHHSISVAYLQNYLDEHTFRYNRRNDGQPMFWAILGRVRKTSACAA